MTGAAIRRKAYWRAALLLLACALLLKLPAGFMPANARGIAFGWCNAVNPAAKAQGKALLEKALADRPAQKKQPAADETCPLAGAAQPLADAAPLPALAPPVYLPFAPRPIPAASPGRGLVAPPPFATGPPTLA